MQGTSWCCGRGCTQLSCTGSDVVDKGCKTSHKFGCCICIQFPNKCPGFSFLKNKNELLKLSYHFKAKIKGSGLLSQHQELMRVSVKGKRIKYWKGIESPIPRTRNALRQCDDLKALLLNPFFQECQTCLLYESRKQSSGLLRKHIQSTHVTCVGGNDWHSIGELRRLGKCANVQICCLHGLEYTNIKGELQHCDKLRFCCANDIHLGNNDNRDVKLLCPLYSSKSNRLKALTSKYVS